MDTIQIKNKHVDLVEFIHQTVVLNALRNVDEALPALEYDSVSTGQDCVVLQDTINKKQRILISRITEGSANGKDVESPFLVCWNRDCNRHESFSVENSLGHRVEEWVEVPAANRNVGETGNILTEQTQRWR